MKKGLFGAVLFLTLAVGYSLVRAGALEPPGPPAPTMVTLQQIYDKLTGLAVGVVGVPKTSQTGCWDESGTPIPCAGTGQDGEYQRGVTVSPRFSDDGNGTVKDNLTGLIWLKNANCFGKKNWMAALSDANNLASGSCGLTDGSVAGHWRLPNINEMLSLIDYSHGVSPALPAGQPFSDLPVHQGAYYWFSTTDAWNLNAAWKVDLSDGDVTPDLKATSWYVWPIRGGQ